MSASAYTPIMQLDHLSKRIADEVVVDAVDLDIFPGELHIIAGPRSTGKSMLLHLIALREQPSQGYISIDGQQLRRSRPQQAQHYGIVLVSPEHALVPHLSVSENLSLGREPTRFGIITKTAENAVALQVLRQVRLTVAAQRLVATLTPAEQLLVAVAKALVQHCRLLVFDEPISTLTTQETATFFQVLHDLIQQGIAVFASTHYLREILDVADRISIMQEGKIVLTILRQHIDEPLRKQLLALADHTPS